MQSELLDTGGVCSALCLGVAQRAVSHDAESLLMMVLMLLLMMIKIIMMVMLMLMVMVMILAMVMMMAFCSVQFPTTTILLYKTL